MIVNHLIVLMMPPNDLLLFSLLPQIRQVLLEMQWIERENHLVPLGVEPRGRLSILVVCPISSVLTLIARRKGHT
jgi:hypothetical protein